MTTPRPTPSVAATSAPTPETPSGPMTAALGESVGITCGATECLQIVVSQVSETPAYYDPDGYFDDEPEVPGNVFIQSYIDYLALDDGATYNPDDWALYVNGAQVSHHAFTIHGPQPELGSGGNSPTVASRPGGSSTRCPRPAPSS